MSLVPERLSKLLEEAAADEPLDYDRWRERGRSLLAAHYGASDHPEVKRFMDSFAFAAYRFPHDRELSARRNEEARVRAIAKGVAILEALAEHLANATDAADRSPSRDHRSPDTPGVLSRPELPIVLQAGRDLQVGRDFTTSREGNFAVSSATTWGKLGLFVGLLGIAATIYFSNDTAGEGDGATMPTTSKAAEGTRAAPSPHSLSVQVASDGTLYRGDLVIEVHDVDPAGTVSGRVVGAGKRVGFSATEGDRISVGSPAGPPVSQEGDVTYAISVRDVADNDVWFAVEFVSVTVLEERADGSDMVIGLLGGEVTITVEGSFFERFRGTLTTGGVTEGFDLREGETADFLGDAAQFRLALCEVSGDNNQIVSFELWVAGTGGLSDEASCS